MGKIYSPKFNFFILVLFASICLRIYHLSHQSYWIDEMVSLYFVTRDAWFDIFRDNHPFLFHFLLKLWVKIWGTSEFATRFLSVIFSTATTVVMYKFAKKIIKKESLVILAAFLHAVSTFSIIYAQEARMYALFELLTAINLYYFYQVNFENNKSKKSYLISNVVLALTHYGALIIFSYNFIYLLILGKIKKIKTYISIFVATLLTIGSYLFIFSWQSLDWQKIKYAQEPMAQTPLPAFLYFSNLSFIAFYIYLITFLLAYLKIKNNKSEKNIFFYFFGLIVFSISTLLIVSTLTGRALMLPRYVIFLNPVFILLFAYSLSLIGKKQSLLLQTLIIVLAIWNLPKTYYETKAPWRDVASKISQYPNSLVLTTRTLAIQTPYLEKNKISIQRFDPQNKTASNLFFLKYFKDYKNLWVVENFWGGSNYLNELEENLKTKGFNTEIFTFKTSYSEPLTALRITLLK